jgi:(4S)-4-hydroxy-5-phosphonooxypentane-2,3-dione isomerase
MQGTLLVVHVHVRVRSESIGAFRAASLVNAEASRREPGVVRFDVIQERDDPGHFVLVEVYRGPDAVAAHKQTSHYATWRDAVASMMAEPRQSTKFVNVSPADPEW